MKPTIALVGRPNVGKSTLFNRLTKTRDALVADFPGLTRDRHYGHGKVGDRPYFVVDTGGFEPVVDDGILHEMARQTLQAVDESDAVIFIVDGRSGITPQDKIIAQRLRQSGRPIWVAVNKVEGMTRGVVTADFFELGLGDPIAISAAHGEGVRELISDTLERFPIDEETAESDHPKFAVIGRPNVGKSTLVNAVLGEERVIAFDQPGTTRDSVYIDFERNDHHYTIIDTAGMRRRGKIDDTIEKFSVVKTMQAVSDANVAVLVLDATQEVSDQDARLASFVLETGRALVVAINKWEAADTEQRERIKREVDRKLAFLEFAKFHYISALNGQGVGDLFKSIDQAYHAAMIKIPTPKLTRALQIMVERQQPPLSGKIRPKLRYAHQGGTNPPVVIIHGNALEQVPAVYWRYLERSFMNTFKLQGTPLRVQFKMGANPFQEKQEEPKKLSLLERRKKMLATKKLDNRKMQEAKKQKR
ncbi:MULTISPECIES: ribosome biogenesis GTPase Der [Silvimonas]|uniref:ribosome biogenesis GTPase Der n=1 Tax=Silvimonas TaxID=300264 RepID=UPI0024B34D26|nr:MULTISPECIES: ribosome biogenesis GTPase Der [Silvimonas]MDR3428567.1 ribosome biogenesis GTPase Der [Silvimonas sp.]